MTNFLLAGSPGWSARNWPFAPAGWPRLKLCIIIGAELPQHHVTSLSVSLPFLSLPLPSLRADEPGHPSTGNVNRLPLSQRPAVADRRHAHPPPLHPEERRGLATHCLPVQPQPWWAALHTGGAAACSTQRRHADAGGGAALAEVHCVLRHRVR